MKINKWLLAFLIGIGNDIILIYAFGNPLMMLYFLAVFIIGIYLACFTIEYRNLGYALLISLLMSFLIGFSVCAGFYFISGKL